MPDESHLPTNLAAPEGFEPLQLGPPSTFMGQVGPLYGKRVDGKLVLGFRVEERHANPIGICHGGMLATLADMVLGAGSAIETGLSRFLPTVNLACDFLAPAPIGSWVEGHTEILRTTRNLVFAQCVITVDGKPALRASGIMKIGPAFTPDNGLMVPSV